MNRMFALLGALACMGGTLWAQGTETGAEAFRAQEKGIHEIRRPFSLAVIPDTQYYSANRAYAPIFESQVKWVLEQQEAANIAFVTHLGDVVDGYTDRVQWTRAMKALQPLLNQSQLPFSILRGNHDDKAWFKAYLGPQIFMVLNGHTHTEYHMVSRNAAGEPVIQMLSDYQDRKHGGNGLLRLITLDVPKGEIRVRTHCPGYTIQENGRQITVKAFDETDANSRFTIPMDFEARFASLRSQDGQPENSPLMDNESLQEALSQGQDADESALVQEREALQTKAEDAFRSVNDESAAREFDPICVKPAAEGQRFMESTHRNLTEIAARYWKLPESRVQRMTEAADMPDTTQAGIEHGFNQQWSHAYMLNKSGNWAWGDASEDFHDNIDGYGAGQQGHEGYQAKSAKDYYEAGNASMGDWYLGYATHYMADISLTVHASFPTITSLDLLTRHLSLESWIEANERRGHHLLKAVEADSQYYPVQNLKESLHRTAYFSSCWSKEDGARLWEAYRASGYPTTSGSGSKELVEAAQASMIRACRYLKGTVKYTLDKYQQWQANY